MKKSLYNIASGFVGQIVSIALGIVIPRLILVNLGSEINGLVSSVNQMLVYIGLLEAGVGTASLQALYGPIGRKDRNSVNSIMAATNKYYTKTGVCYFILVIISGVVYSQIITTEIPKITVFMVVLLSGIPGSINYLFQGKFKILLQAEGKNYIITNLTTVINICVSISKIVLLNNGYNIIAIQFSYMIFNMLQMVFIAIYMRKNYKWLNLSVKANYDAIAQKDAVLIHQISSLVFSNTDVMLLTIFCGLKVVSVYSMYTLLYSMLGTAISTINSSVIYKMGQSFNNNKKLFYKMHNAFETYNMALTFSLFCIANIFIIPFIRLYTSGVKDINYIDNFLPYLFSLQYLLSNGRTSSNQVINYAGHFKLTQNRAIIEASINLAVSIIAVQIWGIYGVIIGTIVALLYRSNDMILYASRKILHKNPMIIYRRWITCMIIFIIISFITKMIKLDFSTYSEIILGALLSSIVIIPIFFGIMSYREKESYIFIKQIFLEVIEKKGDK